MPDFYSCDICSCYHPAKFEGDCRDASNRFTPVELDEKYGGLNWNEVEESD